MSSGTAADVPACHLFAGPSLGTAHPEVAVRRDLILLPPARRGSIAALVDHYPPGDIALADGMFHQVPAVGHQEIRRALVEGWRVWGLSSMGAIRAFEMCGFGMRGFGQVYEWFVAHPDFTDDEVALLHAPDPPYTPVTEPLIHMRFAVADLARRGIVEGPAAEAVLASLAARYFGERTLEALRAALLGCVPAADRTWAVPALDEALLRGFARYRVKTLDLLRFIETTPWKTSTS
jgi:hypothetical protein